MPFLNSLAVTIFWEVVFTSVIIWFWLSFKIFNSDNISVLSRLFFISWSISFWILYSSSNLLTILSVCKLDCSICWTISELSLLASSHFWLIADTSSRSLPCWNEAICLSCWPTVNINLLADALDWVAFDISSRICPCTWSVFSIPALNASKLFTIILPFCSVAVWLSRKAWSSDWSCVSRKSLIEDCSLT